MAFDGTGTYNPLVPPVFPAVAGTTILADDYNQQIRDMASALSACITRDGQSAWTGDQNAGGKAITNLNGLTLSAGAFNETSGADIPSAATLNLTAATGNTVDVTGTTTITAITLGAGAERTVRFTGALTLTNGANLVLGAGVNVSTQAGDFAIFRGYALGVVRMVYFSRRYWALYATPNTAAPISTSGWPSGLYKVSVPVWGMAAVVAIDPAGDETDTYWSIAFVSGAGNLRTLVLDYDRGSALLQATSVLTVVATGSETSNTAETIYKVYRLV